MFERVCEFTTEMLGSTVEVRLVHGDNPTFAHNGASSTEHSVNFGVVVGIVVIDAHPTADAMKLESAFGAAKL